MLCVIRQICGCCWVILGHWGDIVQLAHVHMSNGDPGVLFNIVWKYHNALDLILDFKHPMKIQLANLLYVDQLGWDVIMPLGPPKTPQMAMHCLSCQPPRWHFSYSWEQICPVWAFWWYFLVFKEVRQDPKGAQLAQNIPYWGPFRVPKWAKKRVCWVMASVNKPVGLSCGVWKMFEKKTRCHKRCLGGQQCWKGAHKTPLDPFWTPLSLLNPSLVPRPTWDIHVSRGTRLPQSPQWSPNEHHQVAPSDHPSHPI